MMANNTTSNNTNTGRTMYTPYVIRPHYDYLLLVLAFLIVLVNMFVIVLFIRKTYLRTKTNSVLISLAISDLLCGLISIPTYVFCSFVVTINLCTLSNLLYRCVAISTIFHILVVILERYIAVIYPMRYYRVVTKQRVCIAIALVWSLALFYSLIQLTWVDFSSGTNAADYSKYQTPYQVTGFVLCFVLPLLVMIVCITRMFVAIRRQVMNMRKHAEISGDPRSRSIASDRRALIIFSTMLGIFVFCWSTWYASMFLVYSKKNVVFPELALDVFDFLRFFNCLVNPLLYTFLKNDFRRAVTSTCSCFKKVTKLIESRDSQANVRMTVSTDLNGRRRQKSSSLTSNARPTSEEETRKDTKTELETAELLNCGQETQEGAV